MSASNLTQAFRFDPTQVPAGVTPDMVASFSIGACMDSLPCKHGCTIAFCDGTKVSRTLDMCEIFVLIQTIASEKIFDSKGLPLSYHFYEKHPDAYDQRYYLQTYVPRFGPLSAMKILGKFRDNGEVC